jgi:hypothetical protein
MRLLLLVSVFFCLLAPAKDRAWQDAKVVKVDMTETESEDQLYRSSAPSGQAGQPLASGGEKHTKKTWTYTFQAGDKKYAGVAEKKSLEGVKQGDDVKIFSSRGFMYVLMPDGKERKLDAVKPE